MRGALLGIWEGSPMQRGPPRKDVLRRGAAQRLHVEQLPGYAPQRTPDAGSCNSRKRVALGNRCGHDLPDVPVALRRATARRRHTRSIIQACVRQAGYHV